MIACGIDFETTGFKAGVDRPTEVGAVIFNSLNFTNVMELNWLLWDENYPKQSPKIIEITGITDELLTSKGVPPPQAFKLLANALVEHEVECLVAHNATFDKGFYLHEMKKLRGTLPDLTVDHLLELPWVCSYKDIKHPEAFKSKKLGHLALDYGCSVNPEDLHRASGDVNLMIQMLAKARVNLEEMLGYSKVPDVFIRAVVPSPFGPRGDGGKGKDSAKACGFSWQSIPGEDWSIQNSWLKKVKQNEIEEVEKKLGYKTVIVEKGGTNAKEESAGH